MWTKRERGAHSNDTAAGDSRRAATPGKHTLTEALAPVQRKAESLGQVAQPVQRKADGTSGGEVMAAAQHGVSGPPQALPHGDRIQALFGRHDVAGIRAHVAGPAAEASEQIGAAAYATGSLVAFREAPDLHTAAHEAAHVVQQRGGVQLRGGIGETGDAYERHADAVADAVVAGKPAGGILDQMAGGSSSLPGVQKKPGDPPAAKPPAPKPVGTNKTTDFGEYWVVPDGTKPADAKVGQKGELIEQTKFTAVEDVWNKVKGGTGKLLITETDKNGGAHAGFKAATLPRIGMLMSRPKGRELITGLVNGSKKCTIRPAPGKVFGGASTEAAGGLGAGAPGVVTAGKKGAGDDSFVDLDANVGDNDIKVHDAAGNDISDPVYIFLGHELIHARHIAAGEVDMGAPADPSYGIKEEETTIATGGLSENDLRAEHGLTKRHDHGGSDTRP
jgi:hypothetical protein